MKFLTSIILCSALGATIIMGAGKVDPVKCSVQYIKDLMVDACLRSRTRPRREIETGINQGIEHRQRLILQNVLANLPANVEVRRRVKRDSPPGHIDHYLEFCCRNMNLCENMRCPL